MRVKKLIFGGMENGKKVLKNLNNSVLYSKIIFFKHKMKFFSLMSCIFLAPLSAFAAGVVADIPAGNYTHPIEVRLSTDLPDADIFYYTDGKGYFETISPYEKPILLKKNTQLDFFAMTPDMNQTPIYTQVYTFSYPDIFTLSI